MSYNLPNRPRKFTYFTDPGHGWLKVPLKILKDLEIEKDITHYSYQKGDFVYLEEDCDMTSFINKFQEEFGENSIEVRQAHTNRTSKIRSYDSYDSYEPCEPI